MATKIESNAKVWAVYPVKSATAELADIVGETTLETLGRQALGIGDAEALRGVALFAGDGAELAAMHEARARFIAARDDFEDAISATERRVLALDPEAASQQRTYDHVTRDGRTVRVTVPQD